MCLLSVFRQYTVTWCLGLRGVVIPHHRWTVPPPPLPIPLPLLPEAVDKFENFRAKRS